MLKNILIFDFQRFFSNAQIMKKGLKILEIRGVMLDISRDKVPTLKTLFEIVDLLSLLKINHLQLYVEGFLDKKLNKWKDKIIAGGVNWYLN